jgi:hypothetical protein
MGKLAGNYRYHDHKTSAGASETFVGSEVPRGKIAILTYTAVCDYTTADKTLVLGIRDAGGTDHYLKVTSGVTTANGTRSSTIETDLVLLPGERPIGIIVSASASDVCYFTAHGGLYAMEEGGAA